MGKAAKRRRKKERRLAKIEKKLEKETFIGALLSENATMMLVEPENKKATKLSRKEKRKVKMSRSEVDGLATESDTSKKALKAAKASSKKTKRLQEILQRSLTIAGQDKLVDEQKKQLLLNEDVNHEQSQNAKRKSSKDSSNADIIDASVFEVSNHF